MAIEVRGTSPPDGTALVKSSAEKIHLYGGTAVTQAATIADAVSATGAGQGNSGTAASSPCTVGDMAALMAIINTLLSDLTDLGIHASA